MLTTDGHFLQELTTLSGPSIDTNVVQTAKFWKDTGNAARLALQIRTEQLSECHLFIETSATRDSSEEGGPWEVVADISTAHYNEPLFLHADADGTNTKPLQRFVRWRVKSDGTVSTPPWEITFSIALVMK